MSHTPVLSILLSSFNYGRFIGDAIKSVLDQNFDDYELLIVDNASTDDSIDVIKSFNDERIRLIVNPKNLGGHASMEILINNARGKYLRMLCADDKLVPGIVSEQIQYLERYECVKLVTCDFIVADATLQYRSIYPYYRGFANGYDVIYSCLSRMVNDVGSPSCIMFRAEDARKVVIDRSLNIICDVDFCLQLIKNGCYYNTRSPGVLYRRHESTDTKRVWSMQKEASEWTHLIKKYDIVTFENLILMLFRYKKYSGIGFMAKWLAGNLLRPRFFIRSIFFMLANCPHNADSLSVGNSGKLSA